jgi:hypothetical protein
VGEPIANFVENFSPEVDRNGGRVDSKSVDKAKPPDKVGDIVLPGSVYSVGSSDCVSPSPQERRDTPPSFFFELHLQKAGAHSRHKPKPTGGVNADLIIGDDTESERLYRARVMSAASA